jgi:hypothetical protein
MFNACIKMCVRIALIVATGLLAGGSAIAQPLPPVARGPLARLVRTPDDAQGVPPYALADQTGTIQRYVEPMPGIDLDSYLNQIVTVRHDTGETLLASQLELPQRGLYPMVDESFAADSAERGGRIPRLAGGGGPRSDRLVRQAEFVDNDDSTVELMDDEQIPGDAVQVEQGAIPEGAIYPDGTPAFPGPMQPGMPMMNAAPMYYGPSAGPVIEPYPSDYGAYSPYAYPSAPMYGPNTGFIQPFGQPTAQPPRDRPHLYGDVEINFIRAHVNEEMFGKLSEKYEFSPRFVIGFTDVGSLSGRVRYWIYGRGTNGLSDDDDVHIDFDVWDVEATHQFSGKRSQVLLAGGVRLAKIEFEDSEDEDFGADLIGLTLAADGWTPLLTVHQCCLGWTYGGRLSILAGDWAGDDDSEFLNERVRDDNAVVHELYAGVGFTRCCGGFDVNGRLVFEMQNWHSDVLDEFDGTLGFVGPGAHIGAEF